MSCSFLKEAVVAVAMTVLAATATASSYASAAPRLPAGFLFSAPFLWIAANVIVVWLVSSFRHHRTASSSASHADDVSAAMDSLYLSSEHDVFADVVVPEGVVAPVSRRQTREARTAKRPTDRPRVRKKSAGEQKPRAVAVEAKPDGEKEPGEEQKPRAAAAAAEAKPGGSDDVSMDSAWQSILQRGAARPAAVQKSETWGGEEKPIAVTVEAKPDGEKKPGEEEKPTAAAAAEAKPGGSDVDVSMDSAWQSILQRGAARPVAVRKSETWGGEELPRMKRAADKAVVRREMRKSATMVPPSPPHPAALAPAAAKQGWRTRDVLGMAQGELLRRAESFIRRQYEQLRLQRQESEQRQATERERRRPAPIRV